MLVAEDPPTIAEQWLVDRDCLSGTKEGVIGESKVVAGAQRRGMFSAQDLLLIV